MKLYINKYELTGMLGNHTGSSHSRPAGSIFKIESIDGYNVNLRSVEFKDESVMVKPEMLFFGFSEHDAEELVTFKKEDPE